MVKRQRELGVLIGLLLALAGGCKKSEPAVPRSQAVPSIPSDVVARVHWLGKDRLARETNAAAVMRIWQTPESVALENETIQKLSRAPWRHLDGEASATNANSALLQPLLEDVVKAESYLEIRQLTNQPYELAFAIRLSEQRARLWETNLAGVLESLTGSQALPIRGGWQLRFTNRISTPNSQPLAVSKSDEGSSSTSRPPAILFARCDDWMLVGLAREDNSLIGEFQTRIGRDHAPFGPRVTNFWLEADLELRALGNILSPAANILGELGRASATIIGDGENVRSRAELALREPMPSVLTPWNIPTNFIRSTLMGLTVAREIGPLAKKMKLFGSLPADAPDQFYLWDRNGAGLQMYFAAPLNDAKSVVNAVAEPIMNWVNPRIAQRHYGSVSVDTNAGSLSWDGLPFAAPFLEAVTNHGQQYVFGGFGAHSVVQTNGVPPELLAHIVEGTNLLYFDWDQTGDKLVHWRYLDDTRCILFDAARLSRFRGRSASLQWIIGNATNLSHSVTEVRLVDANRLSFARKSTIGLTSLEIDFLANWLNLPQFPSGLETILRTNSTPRLSRQRSTPATPAAPK